MVTYFHNSPLSFIQVVFNILFYFFSHFLLPKSVLLGKSSQGRKLSILFQIYHKAVLLISKLTQWFITVGCLFTNQLCLLSYYSISVFRLSIFHNLIFSMAVVWVATRGHVHGRDEVVLDELSKSGDLLVFLLHDLDVLGKLQHKFVMVMVSTTNDWRRFNVIEVHTA